MTKIVQVQIDNDTFEVGINGTVYQPRRVSSTVLDEVRLIASKEYLAERKSLTASQALYWTRVCRISMVHERGHSMGAPNHV